MKKIYDNSVDIYISPFELIILIVLFISLILSILWCEGVI